MTLLGFATVFLSAIVFVGISFAVLFFLAYLIISHGEPDE